MNVICRSFGKTKTKEKQAQHFITVRREERNTHKDCLRQESIKKKRVAPKIE